MSEQESNPPPWWTLASDVVPIERVAVRRFGHTSKSSVQLGQLRLICTLEQWREMNAAVEAGFADLREPADLTRTTGKVAL